VQGVQSDRLQLEGAQRWMGGHRVLPMAANGGVEPREPLVLGRAQ
jgi:hypothetical protein